MSEGVLIALVGAVAVIVGAVVGAVLLARSSTRALRINREGQISERFTRAIDQLGQTGEEKLDVRLGGIYALERIAQDSESDRGPIVEVLTAFLRRHARWKPGESQEGTGPVEPGVDVQAAVTVLGRNRWSHQHRFDLHDVDLRKAKLYKADLQRAILIRARLEGANLIEADLQDALFVEAHLKSALLNRARLDRASLTHAQLQRANLFEAHLEGTFLAGANLEGANLRGAQLAGANFFGAQLRGADLGGAHLRNADFTGAHLWGVIGLENAHLDGVLGLRYMSTQNETGPASEGESD